MSSATNAPSSGGSAVETVNIVTPSNGTFNDSGVSGDYYTGFIKSGNVLNGWIELVNVTGTSGSSGVFVGDVLEFPAANSIGGVEQQITGVFPLGVRIGIGNAITLLAPTGTVYDGTGVYRAFFTYITEPI